MEITTIKAPFVCPECGGWLRLWRVFTVRERYEVMPITGQAVLNRSTREHTESAVECSACGFYSPEGEGLFVVNGDGDLERGEPVADDLPF